LSSDDIGDVYLWLDAVADEIAKGSADAHNQSAGS
jgi:hypothetical protein